MEFSRQEYWSGLPFPSPGDLPNPGIEPGSPALAGGFFTIWATKLLQIWRNWNIFCLERQMAISNFVLFFFFLTFLHVWPLSIPYITDNLFYLMAYVPTISHVIAIITSSLFVIQATLVAHQERTCLQCRRCGLNPWVRKIPWRKKWQLTPVFMPGKSYCQRSLVGYSSWGCKESDMTQQLNRLVVI